MGLQSPVHRNSLARSSTCPPPRLESTVVLRSTWLALISSPERSMKVRDTNEAHHAPPFAYTDTLDPVADNWPPPGSPPQNFAPPPTTWMFPTLSVAISRYAEACYGLHAPLFQLAILTDLFRASGPCDSVVLSSSMLVMMASSLS